MLAIEVQSVDEPGEGEIVLVLWVREGQEGAGILSLILTLRTALGKRLGKVAFLAGGPT